MALAAFGALSAGCAHAPGPAGGPEAQQAWPPAPARPQVRWAGAIPSPPASADARSAWRRALDAAVGLDGPGSLASPLAHPFGLAAHRGGLLIADPEAQAVLQVGPAGALEPLSCPARRWEEPLAIAVAGDAIFVADAGEVVRVDGRGCSAFGSELLERPSGLAALADRLFVVDPPRHDLLAFDLQGGFLWRLSERGGGAVELLFPTAVAGDGRGALLVVDALHFRVTRLSPDGAPLGSFGRAGTDGGGFARPKAVAVDRDGRLYVSDAARNQVLVLDAGGQVAYAIGEAGAAAGEFLLPAGLAVDGNLLFVADSQNRRVQIFELLGDVR